jgi:hypothetical protein
MPQTPDHFNLLVFKILDFLDIDERGESLDSLLARCDLSGGRINLSL